MTKVIELYGGPGCGKSTTAAGLFYLMKLKGHSVELVREYVKNWAWDGRKINTFDQPYLVGKQFHYESLLYNKVDYIVTDSPVWLCAMYESLYQKTNYCYSIIDASCRLAEKHGVTRSSFLLTRRKDYVAKGRYETLEQAKVVDAHIRGFLQGHSIDFSVIDNSDEERHQAIYDLVVPEKCPTTSAQLEFSLSTTNSNGAEDASDG